MNTIFRTFKPKHATIKKYVAYYYLDVKPDNVAHEFQCFPHFNNTISLYKSHVRLENGAIHFKEGGKPLQIYMPIRDQVFYAKQFGIVHRVVIVFNPLGIEQFFRNIPFNEILVTSVFFNSKELEAIFSRIDEHELVDVLDTLLIQKFVYFENKILEEMTTYIFEHYDSFTVAGLSKYLKFSRQHLNKIFKTHFGVSIKTYHKIILFRKTIYRKLFENPEENFTEVAHQFNYNDQSHFIKTYKTLTGNTPKKFFSKGTLLGDEDTFWHL